MASGFPRQIGGAVVEAPPASDQAARRLGQAVTARLWLLGALVGAMWLVELVDRLLLHGALDANGIRPRTQAGLWGILYAPFLHAGFAHLLANTGPLLILGWLVALRRLREFLLVTALVILLGGLGVWLLGRPHSDHIGASGLVFGYLGYLILRGYFQRSVTAVLVALVTLALYGGALWGMLPSGAGISWESHLFGFAAGAGVSWAATNRSVRRLSLSRAAQPLQL